MVIRRTPKPLPGTIVRTPAGTINNCSLANGDDEKNCQICKGVCPDRTKFAEVDAANSKLVLGAALSKAAVDNGQITPAEVAAAAEAVDTELLNKSQAELDASIVKRRNATSKLPVPVVGASMARIVDTVVKRGQALLDDPGTYERFEKALRVEGAATPEKVRQALNWIDQEAADAHLTYLACKEEFDRWERAAVVYLGPMRDEATKTLQADKAAGKMSKVIAEADIEARMAKLYPDQYQATEAARDRAKMAVKQFERVAELLQKRSYALANMVAPRG